MRYLPHTPEEIETMLARVGAESLDALFEAIPEDLRVKEALSIEPALDEASLMAHLAALASKNSAADALSFLGAGIYAHHIPPAVDQMINRSELYTAYTPYQAELSQGTLQLTFEFQTIVCQLFGMEVANASMYDGASATAEAVLMARRITRRSHTVLSAGLHPDYIATTRSYVQGIDGEPDLSVAPLGADGRCDLEAIAGLLRDDTAALVVGYPNFYGCVEDLAALKKLAEEKGALLITATAEPYALSLLKAPGDLGADITVGEGQALAVPPQYGGPGVGLFACRAKHVRQMPGRLVGRTLDADGKPGFVLTLSTREQHIRRERATSNICTNHGLIALAMAIRSSMLGLRGFVEAGTLCLSRAEYLKAKIAALPGYSLPLSAPTFNEFVVRREAGDAAGLLAALADEGLLAGVDLERFDPDAGSDFLIAVTECHSKASLDRLVEALSAA